MADHPEPPRPHPTTETSPGVAIGALLIVIGLLVAGLRFMAAATPTVAFPVPPTSVGVGILILGIVVMVVAHRRSARQAPADRTDDPPVT